MAGIEGLVRYKKVIVAGGLTLTKVLKPGRATRAVVEHKVRHQPIVDAQPGDVRPGAERLVDARVIEHRTAVIRGPGGEGQHVHPAHQCAQSLGQKAMEGLQRRLLTV